MRPAEVVLACLSGVLRAVSEGAGGRALDLFEFEIEDVAGTLECAALGQATAQLQQRNARQPHRQELPVGAALAGGVVAPAQRNVPSQFIRVVGTELSEALVERTLSGGQRAGACRPRCGVTGVEVARDQFARGGRLFGHR